MGGLAFASIMSKLRKWRVLVLERHFKIGGFTHTFTRPGGWSVGCRPSLRRRDGRGYDGAPVPLNRIIRMVNRFTANLPLGITQQYLERRFRDSQLRAVVTSQWADYGMPPGQSAFATHAVIATHYLNGAWYPNGGAGQIAKAAGAIIRATGGELLPNH